MAVVDLLERRVLGVDLSVELVGRLVATVHDLRRERLKHRSLGSEPLQSRGVDRIVLRRNPLIDFQAGRGQGLPVELRQSVPLFDVQ